MISKSSRVILLAGLLCAGATTAVAQMRYLTDDHRLHKNFHSKFLPKDRDVIVWLPPGYDGNPTRRYPVLYMHDGNTVFGLWRLDETAQALISNKQIEPLIIVCVGNGGTVEDRFDEYTPTRDPRHAMAAA